MFPPCHANSTKYQSLIYLLSQYSLQNYCRKGIALTISILAERVGSTVRWPSSEVLDKIIDGSPNPYAQIDVSQAVPATDPATGKANYREDGY